MRGLAMRLGPCAVFTGAALDARRPGSDAGVMRFGVLPDRAAKAVALIGARQER